MGVGAWAFIFGLTAMGREFMFFLHHSKEIEAAIGASQFSLIPAKQRPWEMSVNRRHQV